MSVLTELLRSHPSVMEADAARELYLSQSEDYRQAVQEKPFVDLFTSRYREVLFAHDYEASDSDAQTAAPLQLAGVFTDSRFRPVDIPVDIYCQLHGDKLPTPAAIEITRIAPSHAIQNGLPEPLFFRQVNQLMGQPGTCSYGYNSIRYDDVVTRFGLYRNLLPPYAREYERGNSRWDGIHVTLAFYYNHKDNEAIAWPTKDDGSPSFKLEALCAANNITQEHAHNAVDDVKAMNDWMAKLRQIDPALMDYCYRHRKKQAIQSVVYPGSKVYLPSFFAGQDKDYCYHLLVLGSVPGDKNKFFGVDVRDIDALRPCFKMDDEEIKRRLYLKKEDLSDEGVERPPLVTFAINQAPVIMTETTPANNGFMPAIPSPHWERKLMAQAAFLSRLANVLAFDPERSQESGNVETALYGGFPSNHDSDLQDRVRDTAMPEAYTELPAFEASRFNILKTRVMYKLGKELSPEWAAHRRAAREDQLKAWYPESDDPWSSYWNDVDTIITDEALRDDLKSTVNAWIDEESKVISQSTSCDEEPA